MKILTTETQDFEFENNEYFVIDYRFDDFDGFQKKIDDETKNGFTHCFFYSISNVINGEYNININRPIPKPILIIKCRFVKSETPNNIKDKINELRRNRYLEKKKEAIRLKSQY